MRWWDDPFRNGKDVYMTFNPHFTRTNLGRIQLPTVYGRVEKPKARSSPYRTHIRADRETCEGERTRYR